MHSRLLTLPATVLMLFSLGAPASAKAPYVALWDSIYPSSQSDDNVTNGMGTACALCHRDFTGGDPFNAYGWKIREFLNGGANIGDSILMAELFDSDLDPTGSTNLEEILADTQPGWTDGNNNTIYHKNGTTDTNQPPASGILGDMDPTATCPDTKYCGTSQNPNNAALIGIDTCDSSSASINVALTNGPPNQFAYLLVGDGSSTVSQPPGANGDLCVVGGTCLGRYDKDVGQITGAGTFNTDIKNAIANPCAGGVNIDPGATWNFQYWHRQPMGQPATFSDAMTVTFQ